MKIPMCWCLSVVYHGLRLCVCMLTFVNMQWSLSEALSVLFRVAEVKKKRQTHLLSPLLQSDRWRSASSNTLQRLSTHTLTDCWLWRRRLVQWTKPLWGTWRGDPVYNAYYHIISKYMFTMIQTIEGDNSVLLSKGHLKILNIKRNLHHLQFISSRHTQDYVCTYAGFLPAFMNL